MKRARKSWNGGSVEAAIEAAKKRRDVAISQGATLCDECNGEGCLSPAALCPKCRGGMCIVPAGGLRLR